MSAHRPTVEPIMSGIVVGVDGSEGSLVALKWAVDEAALRNTTVTAVSAWEPSRKAGSVTRLPPHDDESIARAALEDAIKPFATGGRPLAHELVEGQPTKVLTESSANGELLVVGASEHGRRVGSVALHCVSHAPCTVVVVRA